MQLQPPRSSQESQSPDVSKQPEPVVPAVADPPLDGQAGRFIELHFHRDFL